MRLPGRAAWAAAGRTWGVGFAAATAFGLLDALPEVGGAAASADPAWVLLARQLLPWYGWAALAPLVLAAARRVPLGGTPLAKGLALHLLVGVALSALKLAALLPVTRLLFDWEAQGVGVMGGLGWLYTYRLPGNVIMYLLFAAGASVLVQQQRARDHEVARARLAAELAESELRLLRAQLQPHFLFNALNAVAAFVRLDPPRAERMLAELGELLRLVLHASAAPHVSLEEEMRIVERYAGIHRLRFGDSLDISVGADPEVRSLRVPGVLLQPLVENAVRHAAAAAPGAQVRVKAYREGGQLVMAVANTRPARGVHGGTGSGQAIGLANTRSRLASLYGGAARVDLRDEAEWTVAEIRLPLAPDGAPAAAP